MKARILPPEEWGRLEETQIPNIGPTMRPEDVQILVVEDGDKIVSTMSVLRVTHLESLWIHPEYRGNPNVARTLLKSAVEACRKWADKWVWGCSDTEHMTHIIGRLGGTLLPIQSFMIPIGGK